MKATAIPVIEVKEGNLTVRRCKYSDLEELVYTLVQLIPPGFVASYGDIANVLRIHPRLVGKILSENPQPIVIPCHRVVGSKGLGGYTLGGRDAIEFKKKLLILESGGKPVRLNLYDYLVSST